MSHVTAGDAVINDADQLDMSALRDACEELGLDLLVGQKTFKWVGRWYNDYHKDDAAYLKLGISPSEYGKCSHALRLKGTNGEAEVGLVRHPKTGRLAPVLDYFTAGGAKLREVVGEDYGHLQAAFVKHRNLLAAAGIRGCRVKSVEKLGNGNTVIRLGFRSTKF